MTQHMKYVDIADDCDWIICHSMNPRSIKFTRHKKKQNFQLDLREYNEEWK